MTVDVAVIGCGVVGASIAYQLCLHDASVAILEAENDVCCHTSKANSAIVHAGYDPAPGSLMAKYNVRGNRLIRDLCPALDIPFRDNGSLVLAFSPAEIAQLEALLERGRVNGVPGLSILSGDQARALEPHLSPEVVAALRVPTGAIVDTWELTIAQAEVAVLNGARLMLDTRVTGITTTPGGYVLRTTQGDIQARYVINAAGLYSDQIHNMVAPPAFAIQPVKGEYLMLDKSQHHLTGHTLFQVPTERGKGVLVAPTVHGNLITGPTSEPTADLDDLRSTRQGMDMVRSLALHSVPDLNFAETIRTFSGLRATASTGHDFIIGPVRGHPCFIDVAGIQSPGLTSAPAIAEDIVLMLREAGLPLIRKAGVVESRRIRRFKKLPMEEKNQLIEQDPRFGRVVCRCETVTEGEIVECLHRPIPPRSLDAVKRRCTAGLGRCQGGFCGPRVLSLICAELHMDPLSVLQDTAGSWVLAGETKQ